MKVTKLLANNRVLILTVSGLALYISTVYFQISLWYIMLAGVVLGGIFGKVFCRWVCPIGLMMELLMSMGGNSKFRQMYQYHKLGCPIAWISGWLNKYSFIKVKLNKESCKSCGKCDKSCYIVAIEPAKYSLYNPQKQNPASSYTCSKCLQCVASCTNGSLKYKM